MKEVKQAADVSLRIIRIDNPVLGAWTDSALYGSEADLLDYDSDSELKGYDKHKIFSQRGTFLALLPGDMLESTGDVPISMMDWKTRSGKRVFHATFAAEAQAAGDALAITSEPSVRYAVWVC